MSMKLERLLNRWPSSFQVLITHRMACVGCDFAKFHTTRQALAIYGLDAETFLSDLARAIDSPMKDGST